MGSTWDLTEERTGVFAESNGNCGVKTGLAITSWQLRSGVVTTLIIVVLHIQVDQLGEVNTECATGIVDVLAIQCLGGGK